MTTQSKMSVGSVTDTTIPMKIQYTYIYYIIGLIPHKKKKKIKMINITPIDRVILRKFSKICTILLVKFSTSFQNSFN